MVYYMARNSTQVDVYGHHSSKDDTYNAEGPWTDPLK